VFKIEKVDCMVYPLLQVSLRPSKKAGILLQLMDGAKKMKIRLLLIIIIILFTTPTIAAEHYILDGGTGNGSAWNNALDDFPSTLVRGDTYYVGDGTYGQQEFDDPTDGEKYIYIKKATLEDHGTETGWDTAYGDGVATFFSNVDTKGGDIIVFKTSYWEFDGVVGGGPSSWTSGHGFKVTTDNPKATLMTTTHNGAGTEVASNIHVYHTEFAHVGRDKNPDAEGTYGCIVIAKADYDRAFCATGGCSGGGHVYAYNYIHDSPAYMVYNFSSGTLIFEYNYLDKSSHLETKESPVQGGGIVTYNAHNHTYRYNIFKDIKGNAEIVFYTWHGVLTVDNIDIYGNVFFDSGKNGSQWLNLGAFHR
jgi:hypothetical protein